MTINLKISSPDFIVSDQQSPYITLLSICSTCFEGPNHSKSSPHFLLGLDSIPYMCIFEAHRAD